jgi:GNAT superfamily N-acetyltransferase
LNLVLGAMETFVRAASEADAVDVVRVLRGSRLRFLPYAPPAHSEAQTLHWVLSDLIPSGGVTVATVDEHVVGVVAVRRTPGASWVDQLYVDPEYCGRGIGARLLTTTLLALPRPIRLYSFQRNEGARRFYERRGFSPIQYGDGSSNEEGCPDILYELGIANEK